MKFRFLFAISSISLCGCSTPWVIGRQANGPPLRFAESPKLQTDVSQKEVYQTERLDESQAKMLAYSLLATSDMNCENYIVGLSGESAGVASTLDIAALTLSSVAAIATPAGSAAILSAGSAISTHARQTLTTDVLGGKDYSLIYAAVKDGRAAERKTIEASIDKGKYTNWTAGAILTQVQPYNYECGINFALHYLSQTLESQGRASANAAPDSASVAANADSNARALAAKAAAAATLDKVDAAAAAIADKAAVDADAAAKAAVGTPGAAAAAAKAVQLDAAAKAADTLAALAAKADQKATTAAASAADAATMADAAAAADTVAKDDALAGDAAAAAAKPVTPPPPKK